MRKLIAAAVMAALSLTTYASAQSVNATCGGTVTDVTGALVAAATVTATNIETGVITRTVTNETGLYNFSSLQPGAYRLSVSLAGFFTPNVDVQLSTEHRINFTLPLASVVENVEVTAMRMDGPMAASSASTGFVLTESMVTELPIVGNDALGLVR